MKDSIADVDLAFRCPENWDAMEVVPGGRLCNSCQHIVRDFRDCSRQELQAAQQSDKRVCGLFRKEQLSARFLKTAAALVVATGTSTAQNTVTLDVNSFNVPEKLTLEQPSHFLGFVVSEPNLSGISQQSGILPPPTYRHPSYVPRLERRYRR